MKIHIDLDSFFVSAERTRDKSLCNKPVAIGGRGDTYIFASKNSNQSINLNNNGAFLGAFFQTYDPTKKDIEKFIDADGKIRGILTTSSYEARKYGIKTGMTIREALSLCPHLIIKAPNMALYKELSHTLHSYLKQRIPIVEQSSIDEFYGDLKGWVEDKDVAYFIDMLRYEILRDLDLPVSIGAASSKPIAKLATSMAKPFGYKVVFAHEHLKFVTNIHIEDFPGIGKSMQKKLKSYQIDTLGKLLKSRGIVESWGSYSKVLYKQVNGEDIQEVKNLHVRKSIGISRTFDPIIDRKEIRRRVIILSRHLSHAIMRLNALPTTYHLGIRYEFSQRSHINITQHRLFSEIWFRELVLSLFYKADKYKNLKIIRLSVSCSNFTCNSKRELSLIEFDTDLKQHKLSHSIKILREQYGLDVIRFASEISLKNFNFT